MASSCRDDVSYRIAIVSISSSWVYYVRRVLLSCVPVRTVFRRVQFYGEVHRAPLSEPITARPAENLAHHCKSSIRVLPPLLSACTLALHTRLSLFSCCILLQGITGRMRKQLDPRIPILINNNVKKNHRSFIVLVGDKRRDQVCCRLHPHC